MINTKGNVIVEQIKVGDIHYEYEYGIGIKCEEDKKEKEIVVKRDIVELFNLIADKMETQINVIGNNTEFAMQMID